MGCFNDDPVLDEKTGYPTNIIICNWGQSSFENISTLPRDPNYKKGANYLYVSDGLSYQFYISLEGKDEAEYTESIVVKNLHCGNKICNYGR